MPRLLKKKNPAYRHGMSGTKTFWCWAGMLARCTNKNGKQYKDYGGRGITVCKRWLQFENFYADMGPRPDGLFIDRINNNRGYSPKNCRWATREQQNRNARSNVKITLNGITKCAAEWARDAGIAKELLIYRLRAGWDNDKLLIPPTHGGNPSPVCPWK